MEPMKISSALEEKLKKAESLDEIVQACAEEGIEITKEQLNDPLPSDPEGALSEAALENVSGGGIISWIRRFIHYSCACKYNGGGGGFSSGGGFGGGEGSFGGR